MIGPESAVTKTGILGVAAGATAETMEVVVGTTAAKSGVDVTRTVAEAAERKVAGVDVMIAGITAVTGRTGAGRVVGGSRDGAAMRRGIGVVSTLYIFFTKR